VTDPHLVTGWMLFVERASAEVVVALRRARVRSILIKGPLQQQWLAEAGPARPSADVDVLVDPADVPTAARTLSELGYVLEPEVTPGVGHHASRWSSSTHLPVEVHWTLWGTDPDRTWAVLAEETQTALIADEEVEIPNEAARCLLVALHAAHHGAGETAPVYDLERAIAIGQSTSWKRARGLARDLVAEPAFATGLSLAPSGEALRVELGLDAQTLTERLTLNIAPPTPGAPGYYWFAQQRGLRARAVYVARKVFPPAPFMRFKYPFARRGPAHLVLAYLYRSLWLARWAGPGFVAWRRARKAARASTGRG
jgi:hypothetical protein